MGKNKRIQLLNSARSEKFANPLKCKMYLLTSLKNLTKAKRECSTFRVDQSDVKTDRILLCTGKAQ